MEYNSYQLVSQYTGSLNTGSYLTQTDYSMFVQGFTSDLWYGFSANDVIELGVFDYSQNQIAWGILSQDKKYKTYQYTYLNTLDFPVTYSYSQLISDFILYKNDKILVSPPTQLTNSFGISDGNYILTYNFTREMAGTINAPLVIKEISSLRKELKLVPLKESTLQYEAFCRKKILLSDISPLYLQLTQNCPYGQIFNQISSKYINEINTLKTIFFLNTDGAVLDFLKNIYEDLIIYTNTPKDTQGNVIGDPDRLVRIQGIRTYFNNFLMSNINTLSDFTTIDNNFNAFVSASVERKFLPIGQNPSEQYVKAKAFIYDFFTVYFYNPITTLLSTTYNEKYFSYLRNALNLGNGTLLPIVIHDYLDERIDINDPLTLLIKLQNELPSDVMANANCWISNISQVPYVVDTIIKSPGSFNTIQIGPPNFSITIPNINYGNVNKSYTATDLQNNSSTNREVSVSKKQSEINIDYTDFKNFIIFSSAEMRVNIFKNKSISIFELTSSLQTLENKNNAFILASSSIYPYYTQEYDNIQLQLDEIIDGFDGYESYLYRGGYYQYNGEEFISSSYVTEMDTSASYYDKYNRDSLVNNTPQHILLDNNNDDYIIFLSMMGHFFDNLYVYIANLPSEKVASEGVNEAFTRTVIDYMLETFGWKLDDTLEQASLLNNFLTSNEINGLSSMSAEDRIKTIRNRILINLPQIYKTKGTEEAVRLVLSCYGIPSTLLSIREYGGVNYTDENASYTQYERAYMYQWDTSSVYDHFRTSYPGKIKTIEYKFSIPDSNPYSYTNEQIQWGVIAGNVVSAGDISGSGKIHGGFVRERGKNLGRVFFAVGYKGVEDFKIYSDPIPIFDGNVYSVMIRRNDPDPMYQYSSDYNKIPTKYELHVRRNEMGRPVIKSVTSFMNYSEDINYKFDTGDGYLMIGGWFYAHNGQGYTGTFDKLMLWLDPLPDKNFEDHVNNINSYSFSGSREAHKSLIYRMHVDYPFDMQQFAPGTVFDPPRYGLVGPYVRWMGKWINANPYYSVTGSLINSRFETETGVEISSPFGYLMSWATWSGSQEIVYDSTAIGCARSQSTYPYQFKIIDVPCTSTISKYGPNRFRNEKIKYVSQSYEVRFDNLAKSTFTPKNFTAPDSNTVGFFVDPSDFKNKDILRYFGNFDFMNIIGNPSNAYSESYNQLNLIRKQYANYLNSYSGSNPRFNEMMTLYKLYFNKSIFDTIQNLSPARNKVLTGVLIEPSILERPKYQYKHVESELNSGSVYYYETTASKYFRSPNTKLVELTMNSSSLLFADFNIDDAILAGTNFATYTLPSNPTIDLNMSYINYPSRQYPINYLKDGIYISDISDKYQMGHFANDSYQTPSDMVYLSHPTGSIKYYMLKKWDTYTIWSKSGSWNRTDNPNINFYATSSIKLYEYVVVTDHLYNNLVFSISNGSYFEPAGGYPRNHQLHKRDLFSLYKLKSLGNENKQIISGSYFRSQQTSLTTIGEDGLEDGSLPVQSIDVGNVNLVQSNNVINQ